jgi:ArsR family transcriptional regulator, arsenate/arsenite/antimonite-responsive transcriptional repressor
LTIINILSEHIDGCQYRKMKLPVPLSICCSPLLAGHLSPDQATQIAALFRVLGEPARLQLLSLIAAQPGGEACVCHLTAPLGLSQPTVSHHLKVLYEAGLLAKERRGNWIYYRLVPERFESLRTALTVPDRNCID